MHKVASYISSLSNLDSRHVCFQIIQDGVFKQIVAHNVIDQNEYTTWKFGVLDDGMMWLQKDGETVAEGEGQVSQKGMTRWHRVRVQKLLMTGL